MDVSVTVRRNQERDRLFRDMQRQRDDALATLARLADEHKREMAEVTGLLDECRQAWRRQRLALNDCRSWLLGRLDGVSGCAGVDREGARYGSVG